MELNFIILVTTLCFTIGLALHIMVETRKDRQERDRQEKEKQKRIKDMLKKLDWKQKV
jgi:hypothetical protein